jgi:uncharacterized protein
MKKLLSLTFLVVLLLTACDNGSGNGGKTDPDFDRSKMLENLSQNLIRPAYADLRNKLTALQTAVALLPDEPTAARLEQVRTAWLAAAQTWQFANAYNFGPAGEDGLRKGLVEEVGTFPVSEEKVEAAVAAGQWNLNDFNRDARGLYTVEYLVFGQNSGSAEQVVGAFLAQPKRMEYLVALCADVRNRVIAVESGWQTYSASFVADAGTSAGSSTSQVYNQFVQSFEAIKNFKVGLPLGKRPGQTSVLPEKVEALYSGQSLQLIENHFTALENIWLGRSREGVDGIGFREYLEDVTGGPELIAQTEAQLANIKIALAALPKSQPFSTQITDNTAAVEAFHTELQKHTRFFKSDMSSLLGIAITFSSGDGD